MKNVTADVRQKLISRALNLLSYRPQSVAEMKLKLRRSAVDQTIINSVIEFLLEQGNLDDLKFAKWWVEQRVNFKPKGNRALSFELRQKGLKSEIIQQVLLTPEQEKDLAKQLPPEKRFPRGFSLRGLSSQDL